MSDSESGLDKIEYGEEYGNQVEKSWRFWEGYDAEEGATNPYGGEAGESWLAGRNQKIAELADPDPDITMEDFRF